jgi:hypothetical protein
MCNLVLNDLIYRTGGSMSILIDNGTSNRKHQNHEWTYMQHVHSQMSGQHELHHIPIL